MVQGGFLVREIDNHAAVLDAVPEIFHNGYAKEAHMIHLTGIMPDKMASFDIHGTDEFDAFHFIDELHESCTHLAVHARNDRLHHGYLLVILGCMNKLRKMIAGNFCCGAPLFRPCSMQQPAGTVGGPSGITVIFIHPLAGLTQLFASTGQREGTPGDANCVHFTLRCRLLVCSQVPSRETRPDARVSFSNRDASAAVFYN